MREFDGIRGREEASMLAWENVRKLLGIIHKLFTRSFLIRRERVEGKIRARTRQGK
jgi:hypothetical protein